MAPSACLAAKVENQLSDPFSKLTCVTIIYHHFRHHLIRLDLRVIYLPDRWMDPWLGHTCPRVSIVHSSNRLERCRWWWAVLVLWVTSPRVCLLHVLVHLLLYPLLFTMQWCCYQASTGWMHSDTVSSASAVECEEDDCGKQLVARSPDPPMGIPQFGAVYTNSRSSFLGVALHAMCHAGRVSCLFSPCRHACNETSCVASYIACYYSIYIYIYIYIQYAARLKYVGTVSSPVPPISSSLPTWEIGELIF